MYYQRTLADKLLKLLAFSPRRMICVRIRSALRKVLLDADDMHGGCEPEPAPKGSGKARLLTLADLDRRTRAYQATERLLGELLADMGGAEFVSAGRRKTAQRAAVHGAMIDDMEARWMLGEPVDVTEYLAASNAQRRLLTTLGLERRARDVTPSLRDQVMRGSA